MSIVPRLRADGLALAFQGFRLDRQAMRCAVSTVEGYQHSIGQFCDYLRAHGVTEPEQITALHIRAYMVQLQDRGLKPNSVHDYCRNIKTWCRWLNAEGITAADAFARVRLPRLDKTILPAFSPAEVKRVQAACTTIRDKALVLVLLDTGVRASEACALNVGDVVLSSGAVSIRQGKGRKDRVVYLGAKARKALVRWLLERKSPGPDEPLWTSARGARRLTYDGLRGILDDLRSRSGVSTCHAHTFRRSCALWSLRAGMNVYALKNLMGHADLSVLNRYLAIVESDLQAAHKAHGPVDSLL